MRSILRAILAIALLLGSGIADWAPAKGHEACCCGMPPASEDSCPCPKPEGSQTSQPNACGERPIVVATQASLRRASQGQRRTEPRPEPATWAKAPDVRGLSSATAPVGGRDPDLGRHLARLTTLRI